MKFGKVQPEREEMSRAQVLVIGVGSDAGLLLGVRIGIGMLKADSFLDHRLRTLKLVGIEIVIGIGVGSELVSTPYANTMRLAS